VDRETCGLLGLLVDRSIDITTPSLGLQPVPHTMMKTTMTWFHSQSRSSTSPRKGLYSYLGVTLLLLLNVVQVTAQDCPANSVDHCDDPEAANAIWSQDQTVFCSRQSCAWQTQLFSSDTKPIHCRNLDIIRASDPVPDFLEPCLLWELIYGEFAPTAAPTVSAQPTVSKQPSVSPTSAPSLSPSLSPTSKPSASPST